MCNKPELVQYNDWVKEKIGCSVNERGCIMKIMKLF